MSSSVSSMCARTAELDEKSYANMNSTNSEVEMDHCASFIAPVSYSRSAGKSNLDRCNGTTSKSSFGILSESAGRGGLSMGNSKDVRHSKNQRMFSNEKDIADAGSLPWNDSDDDFRESMYDIPLAQHVRGTCGDSLFSKSRHGASYNVQPVENYTKVPSRREFSSELVNADLPLASTSELPPVLRPNPVDNDEFGVRTLVDSLIDDLPPTIQCQNKLKYGERSLHDACKKMMSSKSKHKSSKEHATTTFSFSPFDAHMPETALSDINFTDEIQADNDSDIFAGILDSPGCDTHTSSSMVRRRNKSKDTKMVASFTGSDDIVGTGVEGSSRGLRHRRKRQINYDDFFDKTFDMPGEQIENVSQSHHRQFSTMGSTAGTASADVLECFKSSYIKPRKEKLTTKSSYVTAVHSGSLSNADENSGTDVDGLSMMRNGLRDTECRRKYHKKTVETVGNDSATVGDVSAEFARPESVVASKQRKSKLRPSSSVSSSGSNDAHEFAVPRDLTGSSSASSLFSHTDKNDAVSRFRPSAAIDGSRRHFATREETNARNTSNSHHMISCTGDRFGVERRDSVDGHIQVFQDAAVSVKNDSNNGSRKERLKKTRSRLKSRGRRVLLDSDDEDDDNGIESRDVAANRAQNATFSLNNSGHLQRVISRGLRSLYGNDEGDDDTGFPVCIHDGTSGTRNAAHLGSELVVPDLPSDDVIVIGSDDEISADIESVNEQSLSRLDDGQQRSEIEINTTTAPEQNSRSTCERNVLQNRRRRTSRTARMTCG